MKKGRPSQVLKMFYLMSLFAFFISVVFSSKNVSRLERKRLVLAFVSK
jgi:hypothetical protein